jgi:hypothetical protein
MSVARASVSDGPAAGTVSADDPWPGLLSFQEADQAFFRGRTREIDTMVRLIEREPLTLLFGRAGLGKTSLLRAGVFPRLRQRSLLPVYVRLTYTPTSALLQQQVLEKLLATAHRAKVEVPKVEGGTLWEFFHRRGGDFWDTRNRLVVPVLVFDQFEEIFTHGRVREGEADAFLDDLSALVTGRPPQDVRRRLNEHVHESEAFDFTKRAHRVVLSLREDFVAHLERLRTRMPVITDKRLRLEPMDGVAAREVLSAGAHLLAPSVPQAIIRFVAAPRTSISDDDQPSADERMVVEPALLSVVCDELNSKRRENGEKHITPELLRGNQAQIIADFYERGVRDFPTARSFVEENLITDEGFRDSIAKDAHGERESPTKSSPSWYRGG